MTDISLDEFTADARTFLEANAPRRGATAEFVWGEGSEDVGVFDEKTGDEERAEVAAAKEWKAREFDAGFGWISGPPDYGGRGLGRDERCGPWLGSETRTALSGSPSASMSLARTPMSGLTKLSTMEASSTKS